MIKQVGNMVAVQSFPESMCQQVAVMEFEADIHLSPLQLSKEFSLPQLTKALLKTFFVLIRTSDAFRRAQLNGQMGFSVVLCEHT